MKPLQRIFENKEIRTRRSRSCSAIHTSAAQELTFHEAFRRLAGRRDPRHVIIARPSASSSRSSARLIGKISRNERRDPRRWASICRATACAWRCRLVERGGGVRPAAEMRVCHRRPSLEIGDEVRHHRDGREPVSKSRASSSIEAR